jgi:hypothetical protein
VKVKIADGHAHVQRLVSVVKKATVFQKYTTKEQFSVVRFLWAKGLNAKDINKELFPVYGGNCRLKRLTTEWQKFR